MNSRRFLGWGAVALMLATFVGTNVVSQTSAGPTTVPKPQAPGSESERYVGSAVCASCHPSEFEAWQGSHHHLAMQAANEQTVLGDFNDSKFSWRGVDSTFFKNGDRFLVRTEGSDGELADFTIAYTFGVYPLQQYLVAFPKGRYQALGIAWDSRPRVDGGQRWFHLYPDETVDPAHTLHWTRRYQTWNMQCAECHSTNLRKNYDASTDGYRTTFSELNVACEACHGPASVHVAWAEQRESADSKGDKGLTVRLKSGGQDAWRFPAADALFAQRTQPPAEEVMHVCGACHSRRSTLKERANPGAPLEDTHLPTLLTQPSYFPDGQQREEDYVWGSFLQSRMYQKGVTCVDCHEPHTLTLRAEGNALCVRCHQRDIFDTNAHHQHAPDSAGAQCVDCHAPERNYMVIDGRRDHSFRLPRPDLSMVLGTPNACTNCHNDRKAEWAAGMLDQWYGVGWRKRTEFATTFAAAAERQPDAWPQLIELANNPGIPGVVRATAWSLSNPLGAHRPDLARRALHSPAPSVRIAALGFLESAAPQVRLDQATPLLDDPVRGVRIEAARILVDWAGQALPVSISSSLSQALEEYEESLELNADWPSVNINRGNLYLHRHQLDKAVESFQRSIALEPELVGGYLSLAEAYRQQSRDDQGEATLRAGIEGTPASAELHHSLGLLLVRQKEQELALHELAEAARLAPDNARFAHVYAIGLNSYGKKHEALAILKAAALRHPFDEAIRGTIQALGEAQ